MELVNGDYWRALVNAALNLRVLQPMKLVITTKQPDTEQ